MGVPVPEMRPVSESGAEEGERESELPARDTTDCFEIEDLDDTGWEFVTRPAEPLPNGTITLLAS